MLVRGQNSEIARHLSQQQFDPIMGYLTVVNGMEQAGLGDPCQAVMETGDRARGVL